MTKYIALLFLLSAFTMQVVLGQSRITKDDGQKNKLPFQFQSSFTALPPLVTIQRNIANDARNIKKAGIDLVEQMDYIKKQCPFLNPIKSSLELTGDRLNTETVNLVWKRENGVDDRLYFIERSFNDSLHFETVYNVWAYSKQKREEKYQLPDENHNDEVTFYRLKLASFSNEIIYSNIVKVKGYAIETFAVYPNPAAQKAQLRLDTKVPGLAYVSVYDDGGRRLFQKTMMMVVGSNLNYIDVSHFLTGTYLVSITLADKTMRRGKIIKE